MLIKRKNVKRKNAQNGEVVSVIATKRFIK